MNLWLWVLAASAACYALKLAGYLVPTSWLADPRVLRVTSAMTVGLLASLALMNAVVSGQRLVIDARLVALLVAALALRMRVPYLGVVLLGAVAAALARLAGMP